MSIRTCYWFTLFGFAITVASTQIAHAQSRTIEASVLNLLNSNNTNLVGQWTPAPANAVLGGGPNNSQAQATQSSFILLSGPSGFTAFGAGSARAFTGTATPFAPAAAQSNLSFDINPTSITQVAYTYELGIAPSPAGYVQYKSEFQIGSFYVAQTTPGTTGPQSGLLTLTPGAYTVGVNALVVSEPNSPTTLASAGQAVWDLTVQEWSGTTQNTAFQPTVISPGVFQFQGLPGQRWFDPIATSGFEFTMDSPSTYFTQAGMPTGLGDSNNNYLLSYMDGVNPIDVWLAPGALHNFPGGIASFKVTDIFPTVDAENPLAFPIWLDFSEATADFTMSAIPEPASLALVGFGIALAGLRRRRSSL
ncbi:MAG: PEP-CTERM sorting domain-containing protein [Pirellulaceae bacterium]|nr:PEP-CTERM sorting domain-containing protein [Pirellulaceae bacterium]